jgi:hypothetical protein
MLLPSDSSKSLLVPFYDFFIREGMSKLFEESHASTENTLG